MLTNVPPTINLCDAFDGFRVTAHGTDDMGAYLKVVGPGDSYPPAIVDFGDADWVVVNQYRRPHEQRLFGLFPRTLVHTISLYRQMRDIGFKGYEYVD